MRSKVLVSIVLLVLAASGAGAFLFIGDKSDEISSVREADAELSAVALASAIDGWFAGLILRCQQTAAQLGGWTGSGQNLASAAARLAAGLGGPLDQAYIVNERSRVVAASASAAALIDQTRGGDWVEAARAGEPSVSGVETDPLLKTHSVAAGVGLNPGGRAASVLVCSSPLGPVGGASPPEPNPASLISAIRGLPEPRGARLALVARYASGLAEVSAEPGTRTVVPADQDIVPAANSPADTSRGSLRYKGEGGARLAASFARTRELWTIVIVRDEEALLGEAGRALALSRVMIPILLLPSVLILMVAARRLRSVERRTDEAKRAFLAIAGHELRTPLTVIRGFSQTLTSRWDKVDDSRKLDILRTISRHARSLEHLVERLLLGAQLEAGVMNAPSIAESDIEPIAQRVVDHHRELTHLHEIELSCPQPVTAKIDPKLFEQVLTHLVENAVKYSPSGGSVTVSVRRDGSKAVVIVEDQGVGLPTDMEGIFQKFVQGEDVDTRTHDEGGVGLGLFIVKTHLDRMGGKVRAERRPEGGARFVVSVPR